jgi:hypothetical protein
MLGGEVLAEWQSGLDDLFAVIAGRFSRVEPRRLAFAYVPPSTDTSRNNASRSITTEGERESLD